jgi:hypothetical protein
MVINIRADKQARGHPDPDEINVLLGMIETRGLGTIYFFLVDISYSGHCPEDEAKFIDL